MHRKINSPAETNWITVGCCPAATNPKPISGCRLTFTVRWPSGAVESRGSEYVVVLLMWLQRTAATMKSMCRCKCECRNNKHTMLRLLKINPLSLCKLNIRDIQSRFKSNPCYKEMSQLLPTQIFIREGAYTNHSQGVCELTWRPHEFWDSRFFCESLSVLRAICHLHHIAL